MLILGEIIGIVAYVNSDGLLNVWSHRRRIRLGGAEEQVSGPQLFQLGGIPRGYSNYF